MPGAVIFEEEIVFVRIKPKESVFILFILFFCLACNMHYNNPLFLLDALINFLISISVLEIIFFKTS